MSRVVEVRVTAHDPPRYKRELKTLADEESITIIEREGRYQGNDSIGRPRYKWDDSRVSVSREELRRIAKKYLEASK